MTVAAVAPGLVAIDDLRGRWPAGKRHAWFAFIMAFLLMSSIARSWSQCSLP